MAKQDDRRAAPLGELHETTTAFLEAEARLREFGAAADDLIRRSIAAGASLEQIADAAQVSHATARRILDGTDFTTAVLRY